MIHLDTCFLVDFLRETARGEIGPAFKFLLEDTGRKAHVSIHVVCELYLGVERSSRTEPERGRVREILDQLEIVYADESFAPTFGRLAAYLQKQGEMIGVMDLLIATAAICADAPLVTRNEKHFRRIPGLRILAY